MANEPRNKKISGVDEPRAMESDQLFVNVFWNQYYFTAPSLALSSLFPLAFAGALIAALVACGAANELLSLFSLAIVIASIFASC